jgi:hypothetical protein
MDAGDGLLDLGLRAQSSGHQVKALQRDVQRDSSRLAASTSATSIG